MHTRLSSTPAVVTRVIDQLKRASVRFSTFGFIERLVPSCLALVSLMFGSATDAADDLSELIKSIKSVERNYSVSATEKSTGETFHIYRRGALLRIDSPRSMNIVNPERSFSVKAGKNGEYYFSHALVDTEEQRSRLFGAITCSDPFERFLDYRVWDLLSLEGTELLSTTISRDANLGEIKTVDFKCKFFEEDKTFVKYGRAALLMDHQFALKDVFWSSRPIAEESSGYFSRIEYAPSTSGIIPIRMIAGVRDKNVEKVDEEFLFDQFSTKTPAARLFTPQAFGLGSSGFAVPWWIIFFAAGVAMVGLSIYLRVRG